MLTLAVAPLYVAINDWLSLERLAARIGTAAGPAPLVVLDPDETTLALAELYLPAGTSSAVVHSTDADGLARARAAIVPATRVLWLVPDRSKWSLDAWLAFLGYRRGGAPPAPTVVPPSGLGELRTECVLQRPGGRAFALLAPAGAATATGTVCR